MVPEQFVYVIFCIFTGEGAGAPVTHLSLYTSELNPGCLLQSPEERECGCGCWGDVFCITSVSGGYALLLFDALHPAFRAWCGRF